MNHFYILVIMALCCSCSGYDAGGQLPIRFEAGTRLTGEVDTRRIVDGMALPQGDDVGIFAYSYTGVNAWPASFDIYDNARATVGAPMTGGSPLNLGNRLYTSDLHAFYSYYPYRSTLTAASPRIESDLLADLEADGSQTDWMRSDPVTDAPATAQPVKLQYRHMMTLLPVMTGKTKDVNVALELQQIKIELADSQKFRFDVSTGTVVRETGGETIYVVTPGATGGGAYAVPDLEEESGLATETAAQVLLLPATQITAIRLRVNGEVHSTPSDWRGFSAARAGEFRLVSIVFGITGITIRLGARDWEDAEETDLTQSEVFIRLGTQGWNYSPSDDTDLTATGIVIGISAQGWKENPADETDLANYKPRVGVGK